MKVTIETNEQDALEMLSSGNMVRFFEDFYRWINGEGRESGAVRVREYLDEIATIYRVSIG